MSMERLKILVVDDESRMRKLVRDFLVKKDFEVLEAGDGAEAVDLFFDTKDVALDDPGCDDAENGRLAGMPRDPSLFKSADHHADSKER